MFKILMAVMLVAATAATGPANAATQANALKAYADAMHSQEVQAGTAAGMAPTGFLPDTGFAPSGVRIVWPPATSGWSGVEDGLRIEPWIGSLTFPGPPPITLPVHAGYYLLGRQRNTAGTQWRGWVARINLAGQLDTGFGDHGWFYTAAASSIVDAALGNQRAYFLANAQFGVPTTQVLCVDFANNDACYSPLAGIQLWNASPAGPNTAAYGQRLLYDSRYGLFVAARVINTNNGELAGIARIRATDGSLVESFGGGGYYIGMSLTADWNENEVSINDMAMPRQGISGGTRLYVAGQGKRYDGGRHGFTFALDPESGSFSTNWGWYWYWWTGTFAGHTSAISALTVLSDGRLGFAGWVESDDPDYRPSYLGTRMPDNGDDPNFCATPAAPMCVVDPAASGGSGANAWSYKPHSLPVALAQTRSGDLIVAERFRDYGFGPEAPIANVHQRVLQYSGTGVPQVKATRVLDPVASTSTGRWSRPFDLWVGGTGGWNATTGSGIGDEVVAMLGTRRWTDTDFDATVLHLKLQSDLLSDGFEGP